MIQARAANSCYCVSIGKWPGTVGILKNVKLGKANVLDLVTQASELGAENRAATAWRKGYSLRGPI